jgi:hypothetical protein
VDLSDAFTEALTGDTTPPPLTGPELVEYGGGAPALARLEGGLPPTGKLPSKTASPAVRRQYDNARRRFERWAAPEGKQRTKNPPKNVFDGLRRRLIIGRRDPLIPDSTRMGARARIRAWVVITTPGPNEEPEYKLRTLPPSGPGVFINRTTMRRVTDRFIAGDADGAADDFLAAFLHTYGFDEAEIGDVESITIWPDGTPEPR